MRRERTCADGISYDASCVNSVHIIGEAWSRQVVTSCAVHSVWVRADVRVLDLLMTVHAVSWRTVHSSLHAVAVRIPAALDIFIIFQLNISMVLYRQLLSVFDWTISKCMLRDAVYALYSYNPNKTATRVQVLFEKLAAVNWLKMLMRIQTYFSLTVCENFCLF